jgi:hypothetical protein
VEERRGAWTSQMGEATLIWTARSRSAQEAKDRPRFPEHGAQGRAWGMAMGVIWQKGVMAEGDMDLRTGQRRRRTEQTERPRTDLGERKSEEDGKGRREGGSRAPRR